MPNEVSWTEQRPQTSIDFFESFKLSKQSSIIDIGGGESRFVDYLLSKGYENITVLDISINAIDKAKFEAIFVKNIEGSDFLHWGKGQISLAKNTVAFQGKISPGPDFKLYLTRNFIVNKKEFLKVKNQSLLEVRLK